MQGAEAPASISDAIARVECAPAPFDAVLVLRGGGSPLDLACFDDYGLALAIANCPVPVYTAIGHERDTHVADVVAFEAVKTPTALADCFIEAFAAEDERISSFGTRLRTAFLSRLAAMESRLDALRERIRRADPRSVLSRGYTLVVDAQGVVIKSARQLPPGTKFKVLFADGTITASAEGGAEIGFSANLSESASADRRGPGTLRSAKSERDLSAAGVRGYAPYEKSSAPSGRPADDK